MRGRMAVLLGLAMLPAGAIAMQIGLHAVAVQQGAFQENLSRRAVQSIDQERALIDQQRELVRVLSASPALQEARAGNCHDWFVSVMEEYSSIASIAVTTNDGR